MSSQATNTKGRIGAAIVTAAMMIAIPFIHSKEGDKLQAYQDTAGVWTICSGVTAGVKPGEHMTEDQCQAVTQSTIGAFMGKVVSLLKVQITSQTLAAHTSFAYNIGIGGYAGSKALRLTNAGKISEGCQAMGNWYTSDGTDCRFRDSGCYGLWQRRQDEIKLCMAGINQGEQEQ